MRINGKGEHQHPIRVVARRTGLTPDVIRAWELRYGAVQPARTAGGQRLYSNAQVERLSLLRRAQQGGRRIGQLAQLANEELARLAEEDLKSERGGADGQTAQADAATQRFLAESLAAVGRMDAERLESVLRRAAVALPASDLVVRVVAPLMARIGEQWWQERLSPGHERLATGVVRRLLDGLRAKMQSVDGPAMVVGTPSGQHHEIGALLAATAAAAQGWRVTYLGPDLPATSIATASEVTGASAVALSLIYPPADPQLDGELRTLRHLLPDAVTLIVGGQAADSYAELLHEIGALRHEDLDDLRSALDARSAAVKRNCHAESDHVE